MRRISAIVMMSMLPGAALAAGQEEAPSCGGNYVPAGIKGHGEISYEEDAEIGWVVLDYIADEDAGCVMTICRRGAAPDPETEDADFFEFDGAMHKLISGKVKIGKESFSVTPKRAVRMKIFSTPSAFPVEKTPLLYRFNHWRENKINGAYNLSPLDYLLYLKANNPTCAGLPLQE